MISTEIEKIFKGFTVDGSEIPFALRRYNGSEKTFITYEETVSRPAFSADDACILEEHEVDFDIFTPGNYKNILEAVKSLLTENGFTWIEDGPDLYEEETGLFHKTTTFVAVD